MAIENIRKSLHKLIDEIDDEDTLKLAKRTLQKERRQKQNDGWDKLSDEEKTGIEQGIKDIEEGKFFSDKQVKKAVKEEFGF